MTRSTAKYLVLLAAATALFYWKIVFTDQYTLIIGSEAVNLSYSWLHFFINSVRQGSLPLWDPYIFAGRPFSGEVLPSAFYPLHLPLALVPFGKDGLVQPWLFHLSLVLTHLLCACFTFALARELRLSRFAAFVGACCFSFSGLPASLLWPPYVESCIWLPAIFLFLLRALRAASTRSAALEASLGGACLGLSILTGGLMFTIMQGIFVAVALTFYASAAGPRAASQPALWRRTMLILAVILAVGAGAGAIQLIPAWEYGHDSLRFIDGGAFPSSEKIPYHRLHPGMWPQSILAALLPTAFSKLGGGEAWLPYIGVLPLFLAVVALWKCWSNLWVRFLAALGACAFLYTLGEYSPLHGWLYALVPYLWVVRTSSRFMYLVSFSLAIIAAFGTDVLLGSSRPDFSWRPVRSALKWIAIACAAAFLSAGLLQLNPSNWTFFSMLLILAACGAFAYLTFHPAGPWMRVLVAAFILFDLTAFNWLPADKADPSKPAAQLEQLASLREPVLFVKSQPGPNRVRVAVAPEPNIGDVYRVHSGGFGGGGTVLTGFSKLVVRGDLLNVRYVIKPASSAEPGALYQDALWKVYENPGAYPRAWIVHRALVEKSRDAAFARIEDPAVDLRKIAVLEEQLPEPLRESGSQESVQFRSYRADRILADAGADSPGLVVFSEMFYPGWRATVNGKPAKIYRVDGGLRGVLVPAGSSRIVLEYVPLMIYAGAGLSLATFLGVMAAFALSRRGRKPLQADAAASN